MGLSKGRSVDIKPRGRGIVTASKMSKVGEIEAEDGVLGEDGKDVEGINDLDSNRDDKAESVRHKALLDKYTAEADVRDIDPEDREDYRQMLRKDTGKQPHQIAAKTIKAAKAEAKAEAKTSKGTTPEYIKNSNDKMLTQKQRLGVINDAPKVKEAVDKKAIKLARQVEDLKRRTKNNTKTPNALTDDDMKLDILKQGKLFERQKQLNEEQRQEEYPDPIKPLDAYKTASELHNAMQQYLTKEEKEVARQEKIANGSDLYKAFTDNKGAKYEVVRATNKEAVAELSKGSNWCIKNEGTAEGYLNDAVEHQFFIVHKDGKPLAAIREDKHGGMELYYFTDDEILNIDDDVPEDDELGSGDGGVLISEQNYNAIEKAYNMVAPDDAPKMSREHPNMSVYKDDASLLRQIESLTDDIGNDSGESRMEKQKELKGLISNTRLDIPVVQFNKIFDAFESDQDAADLALAYAESNGTSMKGYQSLRSDGVVDMEDLISRDTATALRYVDAVQGKVSKEFREKIEKEIAEKGGNEISVSSIMDYMKTMGMARWDVAEKILAKKMETKQRRYSEVENYLEKFDWEKGMQMMAERVPHVIPALVKTRLGKNTDGHISAKQFTSVLSRYEDAMLKGAQESGDWRRFIKYASDRADQIDEINTDNEDGVSYRVKKLEDGLLASGNEDGLAQYRQMLKEKSPAEYTAMTPEIE